MTILGRPASIEYPFLTVAVAYYERRLKENYDQLYNVIHDSSVVSSNLDTLKDTIINTNTASSADIAKIEDVLLGLNYLVNQYEKPLYNFKEIEHYIIRRLDIEHLPPPANAFQQEIQKET